MTAAVVAALAVAGLLAGSWQRAVIFALSVPSGQPPRTGCPRCGRPALTGHPPILAGRTVLSRGAPVPGRRPLVLAVARPSGRCPACRARLGPWPGAVELTTAVALGLLGARVHAGLVLAADCFLVLLAVPLGYIDAAVRRLPNALTGPAFLGTLALLAAAAGSAGQWHSLVRAVLGGLALAAAFWLAAFLSPSAVGGGDVRLAASTGTALAWYGLASLVAGLLAAFVLAAAYGLALLAARRASLKQQIPFGPFLIAGALLAILAAGAGS